jgi:probable HAF family extracellular repeat protein
MNVTPLLAISLLLLPQLARAASFTPLGTIPGIPGDFHTSFGTAVSDDGTVVVGHSNAPIDPPQARVEAFRWSGGAMIGLGDLAADGEQIRSEASDVSADGSVVVGFARNSTSVEAFRWSGGTMAGLGTLQPGTHSSAYAVSADGEVVVGFSGQEAFRWEDGTMTGLGLLPGRAATVAFDVSADGSVVVGSAEGAGGPPIGLRWTDGVMSSLGPFPDDVLYSRAYAVSPGGTFAVGSMGTAEIDEAFRWSDGEILGLGNLPGSTFSQANGVSADGAVVVGVFADTDFTIGAFVWTESSGMLRLSDVLIANGATGLEGWVLRGAYGISPDGRWITGNGQNPDGQSEAFLADLWPVPEPTAAWLLGSALAAWACVRRRIAA